MRVPDLERSVDTRQPQIAEPRFSAPPEDAFGGKVAAARAMEGKAIQSIGEVLSAHVEKQNIETAKLGGLDAVRKYNQYMSNSKFSPKMIKVKDIDPSTGKEAEFEIPEGTAMRKSADATRAGGVTLANRNNQLKGRELFRPNNSYGAEYFDRLTTNQDIMDDESHIKQESSERNKYTNDSYISMMKEKALAPSIDPQSFMANVGDITALSEKLGVANVETKDQVNQRTRPIVSTAIENVMTNQLRAKTPLEDVKRDYIDPYKERLGPEEYNKLVKGANSVYEGLLKEQKTKIVSDRLGTVASLLSGDTSLVSLDVSSIASYDPVLANAVGSAQKADDVPMSPGSTTSIMRQLGFTDIAKKVLASNNPEQITGFITNTLSQGLEANRETLPILVYLAGHQNKVVVSNDQKSAGIISNVKSALSFLAKSGGASLSSEYLKRAFASGKLGKDDGTMLRTVVKDEAVKKHGGIAALPGLPNMASSPDESVETIYGGPNELQGEEYNGSAQDNSPQD